MYVMAHVYAVVGLLHFLLLGQGIFTTKKIKEGALICPYYGKVSLVLYHQNGDWDAEHSVDYGHRERYCFVTISYFTSTKKLNIPNLNMT